MFHIVYLNTLIAFTTEIRNETIKSIGFRNILMKGEKTECLDTNTNIAKLRESIGKLLQTPDIKITPNYLQNKFIKQQGDKTRQIALIRPRIQNEYKL